MRSFHRALWAVGLLLGVLFGFAVSVSPPASASRNSAGVYSLPSGNPVVSGTSISASWANTTLADISTELTASLDRSGRGAMAAPLQLSAGTASSPGLTFSSEPSSGLYRAGASDVRMQVGGAQVQKWSASGSNFPLGIAAVGIAPDGAGVVGTGTGSGAGGTFTGGGGGGGGLSATGGATSGYGGTFTGGAPNGAGIYSTGAGSALGGVFNGGPDNGAGLSATGSGTGPGANVTGGSAAGHALGVSTGTAATATTRQNAVAVFGGDINLVNVVNPSSTVAVTKTLTPKNLISTWAKVVTNGAGGASVLDGFNVASASITGSNVRVTFASPFAGAHYACTFGGEGSVGPHVEAGTAAASTIDVRFVNTSTAASINASTTANVTFSLICTGAQ